MKPIKILISIFLFVAILLFAYGVASFSVWELNPAKWPEGVRAVTAGFGIIFAALATGFVIAYE